MPDVGAARSIARSVLAETLSGSDEYITLWPEDDDGIRHVPTTVSVIRGNYKPNSVGSSALSSVDGDRAVGSEHGQDNFLIKRHVPNGLIDNDLLGGTSVSTGKLQDKAATSDKIAHNPHGNDPLGNANMNDNDQRAIGDEHVKAKGLKGHNLDDNTVGNRVLANGINGGKLARKSVPDAAIHGVHGNKIFGNSSIAWKMIDVQGVVFSHRLEKRLSEERRKSDRKYARKSNA